jgi:SAM-dependent methyltransferase
MLLSNPAKDWAKFGETDPYFGVLSSEANRGQILEVGKLREFYRSGQIHVYDVLRIAKEQLSFEPHGNALDFGCGVGRLTCAMAPYFEEVVGVDVSQGMLAKAKEHTKNLDLTNIRYVNSLDGYVIPENHFDFVHTYIVLQHMDVRSGEAAVGQMVRGLRSGGIGAIHFTYGSTRGRLSHALRELAKTNVITRAAGNILLGRKWNSPTMLISGYSIERMLGILACNGIEKMFLHRVDDWGSLGLFLFFKKGPEAASEWSNPISP